MLGPPGPSWGWYGSGLLTASNHQVTEFGPNTTQFRSQRKDPRNQTQTSFQFRGLNCHDSTTACLRAPQKLFDFEHPHPLLVERLWAWALQGHGAGHPGETLGLWCWALQERWGWALQANSGGWALQGDSVGLGTPERLWGWALQGHSRVGHSRDTLGCALQG